MLNLVIMQCNAQEDKWNQRNKIKEELKDKQEQNEIESLRLTAQALLRAIINVDVQTFIEFLSEEEIVVDVDVYMTKSKIAEDLLNRGKIYCFVFDETKCQNQKKDQYRKSLRTLFINAKEIKIKISSVPNGESHLAVVEYIWKDKPPPPEFFDPWFKLTPKGWKIVNLFAPF